MITPRPLSDARLLRRFVRDGDETAFAELTRRHEGLVRGACRRIVGPGGDFEDAAQSAFLSLARNAPTLLEQMRRDSSLSGWIYRVAVNAALQQRRASRSRRRRETTVARGRSIPRDETARCVEDREMLSILDEELCDLPARYRGPLVLCHLEGKTQQEAATELGLTYGTFRRRLDQARHLLRARLDRRGVMASAIVLAWFSESRVRGGEAVAYVKPRIASGSSGTPSTTTVWSCVGKPISLITSNWLLAAVLLGIALPPAISIFAPEMWGVARQREARPATPVVSFEATSSPGVLASAR